MSSYYEAWAAMMQDWFKLWGLTPPADPQEAKLTTTDPETLAEMMQTWRRAISLDQVPGGQGPIRQGPLTAFEAVALKQDFGDDIWINEIKDAVGIAVGRGAKADVADVQVALGAVVAQELKALTGTVWALVEECRALKERLAER
jgi:hypothetical protein